MSLAAVSHALKGSASIFGSEKATRGAQRLQEMGRSGDLSQAGGTLRELQEEIALLNGKLRGYLLVKTGAKPKPLARSSKQPRKTAKRKLKRKS